jgi:hypothetical protein
MATVAHVEGQIYAHMLIDDQEIPNTQDAIDSITITEGFGSLSPMLRIEVYDNGGAFRYWITQGNVISIMLSRSPDEESEVRKFRVFTTQQRMLERGPKLIIDCIIDSPHFFSGSGIEYFDGTTSDVARQIAGDAGFEYDGLGGTDDNQVWIRAGKTRAQFLRDIVIHGYVDDSSCVYHSLTSFGKLKYINMVRELEQTPTHHFMLNGVVEPQGKGVECDSARDQSVSGVFNQWSNYGFRYIHHSLTGEHKDIDTFNMDFSGEFMPINEEVFFEAEYSRQGFALSPDCGNTHEKYNEALYQNLRGQSMFSERMSIVTYGVTGCDILSPVWFSNVFTNGEIDPRPEGSYLSMAKSTYIKNGTRYAEKFLLARPYLNDAGTTRLLS